MSGSTSTHPVHCQISNQVLCRGSRSFKYGWVRNLIIINMFIWPNSSVINPLISIHTQCVSRQLRLIASKLNMKLTGSSKLQHEMIFRSQHFSWVYFKPSVEVYVRIKWSRYICLIHSWIMFVQRNKLNNLTPFSLVNVNVRVSTCSLNNS